VGGAFLHNSESLRPKHCLHTRPMSRRRRAYSSALQR
jgi:hypothetical protein